MREFNVYASKGGVGCTTTAVMLALELATEKPVLLVSMAPANDTMAVLGAPQSDLSEGQVYISNDIWVADADTPIWNINQYSNVVYDWGTTEMTNSTGFKLFVTTACYLALRRAVQASIEQPDAVVVLREEGRALTDRDLFKTLAVDEHRIKSIYRTADVARAVDAGLISYRVGREPQRNIVNLIDNALNGVGQ
jgi:hypothetical protein